MDNDFEEGLYQIKYEKDGFELSPGYENNIKLIYNIAKALKLARDEELTEAKEKIDQLSGKAFPDQAHEAVEKVYSLLSKAVTVFGNLKFEGDVLIGNLDVRPGNENTFRIEQKGYHGNVEFNPIELYQTEFIEANAVSIAKDELLYLLARCFSTYNRSERLDKEIRIKAPVLSDFHKLYCRQIGEYDAKKIPNINEKYKNNYSALRFLKEIQGDDNNIGRIYRLFKDYNLDLEQVDLMYALKKERQQEGPVKFKLKDFIKEKYGNKICTAILNDKRLSVEERKTLLEKCNSDNYLFKDSGVEYFCSLESNGNDETAVLYLWNKGKLGEDFNGNIIIPNTVKLNEKTYRVSGPGKSAFSDCTSLKSVTMQGTVEGNCSMGRNAFWGCRELNKVTMPRKVGGDFKINEGAFWSRTNLNKVEIPGTVKGDFDVHESAFKNCTALQEIRISEKLQSKLPDNLKDFISIYNES